MVGGGGGGGCAEQSVLRWPGYIKRMEKERMVKRIMTIDVRGVRLRGMPQMRCMSTVKGALDESGMSVN